MRRSLAIWMSSAALIQAAIILTPGVGRKMEMVPGTTLSLEAAGLRPYTSYEVRISHSAIVRPSLFYYSVFICL